MGAEDSAREAVGSRDHVLPRGIFRVTGLTTSGRDALTALREPGAAVPPRRDRARPTGAIPHSDRFDRNHMMVDGDGDSSSLHVAALLERAAERRRP